MLDLAAAGDVAILGPVELLTAAPALSIGSLDPLRRCAEAAAGERPRQLRQTQALVLLRHLGRVGDERFPEIEADGAKHGGYFDASLHHAFTFSRHDVCFAASSCSSAFFFSFESAGATPAPCLASQRLMRSSFA